MSKRVLWAILLMAGAILAAYLFPRWWTGVICFMVVWQAYGLLHPQDEQLKDIPA